jgi:hypothetical protein
MHASLDGCQAAVQSDLYIGAGGSCGGGPVVSGEILSREKKFHTTVTNPFRELKVKTHSYDFGRIATRGPTRFGVLATQPKVQGGAAALPQGASSRAEQITCLVAGSPLSRSTRGVRQYGLPKNP